MRRFLWVWSDQLKYYFNAKDVEEAYDKVITYRSNLTGSSVEDTVNWFKENDQLLDVTDAIEVKL